MDVANGMSDWMERQAARLAILAEISALRALINKATRVKIKLSNSRTNISMLVTSWENELSTFESGTMADVEVTDKFEGVAAKEIKGKLPEPVAKMSNSTGAATAVQGAISSQMGKLDEYIETKQNMITALQAQLQSYV